MNHLLLENCVHLWDPNNIYKNKCKRFVSNAHEPFIFIFCKHCWDPKDVRSFLTVNVSYWRPDNDPIGSKYVANLIIIIK
jgi:hypothetical protein